MEKPLGRNIVLTAAGLKVLTQSPLSKSEAIVLWHLVASLPVTGNVVSKAHLHSVLSLTQQHLNRAMKRLCELGLLMRGPKVGVSHHYKLNPAFIRMLS
ncbi:winged helix DNA-binding protein [Azonexus fungiphilus]|uniref:winged helix DNA-binding protein n=1 Tax=Azonexus fungiphilus TaxID=146940 RepID=UPI0034644756